MSRPHDHGAPLADTGAAGVRAAKVSLAGLGATAAIQAVLVVFTGSVALLCMLGAWWYELKNTLRGRSL